MAPEQRRLVRNLFQASDVIELDVPYDALLVEAKASSNSAMEFLRRELPHAWHEAYLRMSRRSTNLLTITRGSFDYIYDHYAELMKSESMVGDAIAESRLVAAVGTAEVNTTARRHDDGRLRGWIGPTGQVFGEGWDKGHFIAHSLGGAVDGLEANVFLQLRSVNRGGYRQMERYCANHPGVLCFSRPLYDDQTALPASVEFGVLKLDMTWWIRRFPNRAAA
jgi:hypothetical protein